MNAVEYCLLHGLKLAGSEHPAILCGQESLSYGALLRASRTLPRRGWGVPRVRLLPRLLGAEGLCLWLREDRLRIVQSQNSALPACAFFCARY
jgi:hypothetical protein